MKENKPTLLSHYINKIEYSGRIRLLQGNMLTKGAEDE
jgi:hypothetical protein